MTFEQQLKSLIFFHLEEHPRDATSRFYQTVEKQGPKAVIDNRGYARFLKVARGSVTIDEEAIKRDARLDDKFVLTTNTDLPAAEVAQTHKSLWRVERTFREQKSTLEVRPFYHQRDDTLIGHIVASFLAWRLEVDLPRRLDERGVEVSWPDLMRDLGQVQSVLVELDGHRYHLRPDMVGSAHHAFAAAGVPSTLSGYPLGRGLLMSQVHQPVKRVVPETFMRYPTCCYRNAIY